MQHNTESSGYTLNVAAMGRVRVHRINKVTGEKDLVLDQSNLITKGGADIMAKALSGQAYTKISHMYVGYNDAGTVPAVTVDDTVTSFDTYARAPLAFSPGYSAEEGYTNNLAYFTVYITGTSLVPDTKKITSLGLICAGAADDSADKLFSKIAFNPVTYDSTYGFAITWGLTFRSQI